MTHRKHASIRYALVALLCLSMAGSRLQGAPLASLHFTALGRDTTFFPQLSDSVDTIAQKEKQAMAAPTLALNKPATQYVNTYLTRNKPWLQKVKDRSANHFRIIEAVLAKHGLPPQLKYLAVVESQLKAASVSRRGAAGPWQLMPHTARELGLKVGNGMDERTHYTKSTEAAALYLKKLYALFDDWLLVIAAYNGGPGSVLRAIRLSGSRNFWALQRHLPVETRFHVKHFIGVHYFFEAGGSETILTKAERKAFEDNQNQNKHRLQNAGNDPATLPAQGIPVAANASEKAATGGQ